MSFELVADHRRVVLGGIEFNTGLPSALGFTWWTALTGWDSPSPRITVTDRPGADGAFWTPGYHGTRSIGLAGLVHAATLDDLDLARRHLASVTNLVRQLGTIVVGDPVLGTQTEVLRREALRWRVLYAQEGEAFAEFSIGLVSPSAMLMSSTLRSATTTLATVTTGAAFPLAFPIAFGGGTSSQILAINSGTVDTPVRLELAGPLTNPTVIHDTTGSRIRLAITIPAGDVLVIDSDARSITLGGASRRSTVLGRPEWFHLVPGDNTVRLAAESTDPAGRLTAYWRDAEI